MVHSLLRRLVPVALVAAAWAVQAQAGTPGTKPDPLDPNAGVPTVVYRPPFATYRRAIDEAPIPWRQANDTVAGIGGWRAYAREASRPAPPLEPAPPMPAGRGGPVAP